MYYSFAQKVQHTIKIYKIRRSRKCDLWSREEIIIKTDPEMAYMLKLSDMDFKRIMLHYKLYYITI